MHESPGTVALRERERYQHVAQWLFRNLGMSSGGNHHILLAVVVSNLFASGAAGNR